MAPPLPSKKRASASRKVTEVKHVGETLSPGGTKTIDFTLGSAYVGDADDQAKLLDDMLSGEEQGYRTSPGRRKHDANGYHGDEFGVQALPDGSDDDDDDDFGPDDDDEDGRPQRPPNVGERQWDQFGAAAEITEENARLRQEVEDKRLMVRKLGIMLEAMEPVPGVDAERLLDVIEGQDTDADPRDIKIVQLSKKARNLTVENNRLQSKMNEAKHQLQDRDAQIESLKKQLNALASPAAREVMMKQLAQTHAKATAPAEPHVNDTSHTGPQNPTVGRKRDKELLEARKRVARANEESKKLRSALHKELGLAEGEQLPQKVLEEGWRGRAETIVLLKAKVKKLESELEAATGLRDPKVAAMSSHHDVDRLAAADLAEMEEERRRATERLTENYRNLEEDYHQTRGRLDAAKARTSVLENENARFRKQMKVLIGKTENDDQLVDELRRELQAVRNELRATKTRLDSTLRESSYGQTRTAVTGTQLIHQQQQFQRESAQKHLEDALEAAPRDRFSTTPREHGTHRRGD